MPVPLDCAAFVICPTPITDLVASIDIHGSDTPTAAPPEINEPQDDHDTASYVESESNTANNEQASSGDEEWIPGQDVYIDYPKILEILVTFLSGSSKPCNHFSRCLLTCGS